MLSPELVQKLIGKLDEGPAVAGWDEDQRWTLARVRTVIGRMFRVTLAISTVAEILHRAGASPQQPIQRAGERDEPGPDDDATVVTVAQIGAVVDRLAVAGVLVGRPATVFVFDSGYDLTRITYLADGHGVQVLGRVRSDRVFYTPAPRRLRDGRPGRPKLHGNRFELSNPAGLPAAEETRLGHNPRYGLADVLA